jgi:putative transposase
VLNEYYLTKLKPKMQRAYELIVTKCKQADVKAPSQSSVVRRINALSESQALRRREGKKAVEKFEINQGEYPDGLYPLHVLQIDHTRADVILVDDEYRQELGRPWVTMAIDIYSRMVAGFYISFEAPGYFATGQTLYNAMLPKDKLKEKYQFESDWPLWGIPNMIHMDNAKEFRGIDLQNVCNEYGINIVWRPVGKARFGGHIERLLGSLSEHIHTLDGTTKSNIRSKREYNSQKHATMTLNEFEKWLTVLIADVYHKKIHSELDTTPLQMYENGIFGTKTQPPRGLPKRIEDEQFLYVNLLPKEERTIQKYGIQIDNIYYYGEVLSAWIDSYEMIRGHKVKRKFIVRRDPRDISNIWFFDSNTKRYYMIPYRNTRLPKVSIWEYRAAQKYLKAMQNREYNEDEVFEALAKLRQMAFESKNKTKTHRKAIDRLSKLQQIDEKRPKIDMGSILKKVDVQEAVSFNLDDISAFDDIDDVSTNTKKQNSEKKNFIISKNDSDTIF